MLRRGVGIVAGMLLPAVLICGGRGLGIGSARRRLVLGRPLVCLGLSVGWRRRIGSIILA